MAARARIACSSTRQQQHEAGKLAAYDSHDEGGVSSSGAPFLTAHVYRRRLVFIGDLVGHARARAKTGQGFGERASVRPHKDTVTSARMERQYIAVRPASAVAVRATSGGHRPDIKIPQSGQAL